MDILSGTVLGVFLAIPATLIGAQIFVSRRAGLTCSIDSDKVYPGDQLSGYVTAKKSVIQSGSQLSMLVECVGRRPDHSHRDPIYFRQRFEITPVKFRDQKPGYARYDFHLPIPRTLDSGDFPIADTIASQYQAVAKKHLGQVYKILEAGAELVKHPNPPPANSMPGMIHESSIGKGFLRDRHGWNRNAFWRIRFEVAKGGTKVSAIRDFNLLVP
jgi:hypothetical protein